MFNVLGTKVVGMQQQSGLFEVDETGQVQMPAPECAPSLVAGEGRWMFAAAAVTDTDLVLPDGDRIDIAGVKHLGDLVEMAAGLGLGCGGGKALPQAPQLLLTAEGLQRFGIVLPDDLLTPGLSRDDSDKMLRAAGAYALQQAQDAGYTVGDAGLRVHFRMWRQDDAGSRSAEFVVVPAVGLADRQARLFEADAAAVARRAQRFTDAVGVGFVWSGAVTGQSLYRMLHPPSGKARVLGKDELVRPISILRRAGSVYSLSAMNWVRPMHPEEARCVYVHGYDLHAAYLSAMQQAIVGLGDPQHHPEGVEFDKRCPGLWRIMAPQRDNVLLPPLIPTDREGREVWVFTPLLAYLHEIGQEPQVLEAYVWPEKRRLFQTWAEHLDMARISLELLKSRYPADDDVAAVLAATKSVYQGMVGKFARIEDRDNKGNPYTEWHRPDIRGTVVSLANVNFHRKLTRFGAATGRYPIAVFTDEAIYVSDIADPVAAKPEDMKLGLGLGQWDVSRVGRVTAELIAACHDEDESWFSAGVPKQ